MDTHRFVYTDLLAHLPPTFISRILFGLETRVALGGLLRHDGIFPK